MHPLASRSLRWLRRHRVAVVLGLAITATLALLLFVPSKNEALTGGVIAILTLAVNQSFENARRKSEERRWYAEHFLKDKIDSLRGLHAALNDWHRTLNFYGNFPPQTFDEYGEKISPKEGIFLEALAHAQVYLSDEDDKTVRFAMASCRMAAHAVYHTVPGAPQPGVAQDRRFPWQDFIQTHDAAVFVLSRLLNPASLRAVEASLHDEGGAR